MASEPEPPTSVEDLIAAQPGCEHDNMHGDGELAPARACAGAACAGMTLDELERVLGTAHCEGPDDYVRCTWETGELVAIGGTASTPDRSTPVPAIGVQAPYAGTTRDGLGVGVGVGCFVTTLGDVVSWSYYDADTEAQRLRATWQVGDGSLSIEDGGDIPLDGYVDFVSLR